jgi:hypothetical protein
MFSQNKHALIFISLKARQTLEKVYQIIFFYGPYKQHYFQMWFLLKTLLNFLSHPKKKIKSNQMKKPKAPFKKLSKTIFIDILE